MVWMIGDEGFEMTLTAEVPRIIGREIRGAVERFLAADDTDAAAIDAWAVHPGGRSVLDRVEAGLALPQDALDASRAVLREHGNMSSATMLFILQSLHERRGARRQAIASRARFRTGPDGGDRRCSTGSTCRIAA